MTTLLSGCDVSNFTGDISASTASCLAQAGIQRVIVRGSLESAAMTATAQQQIQTLLAAGIGVDVYLWAYATDDPKAMVDDAIAAFGTFPVGRYWLDVEDTSSFAGTAPTTAVTWIQDALEELGAESRPAGIYTAAWCWQPITGDSTAFASVPLWWADYDGVDTLDSFIPFGGWTGCRGKQYSASGSVCGLNPLDLDVMDASLYAPPVPPAPVADVTDAKARLATLIASLAVDLANAQGALADLNT